MASNRPRGRVKQSVAGERYDTNAIPIEQPPRSSSSQRRPLPNMADLMGGGGMPDLSQMMGALGGLGGGAGGMPDLSNMMGALGGGGAGGMPDMGQMMEMMQKMGMGGGMPGMMPPGMGMPPGMPGMAPGMAPQGMMPPPMPKAVHYGIEEGEPVDRLFVFYPNYINSKKTVQEGRRIPKELACEDPHAIDMSDVCRQYRLPHAFEPMKKYPRDWMVSGRIRVRLIKEDGTYENPEFKTRKDLMLKMAELIPNLQSRKDRLAKEAEAAKEASAAAAASSGGAAASASSGSNKKKGKKKGKR